VLAIRFNDDRRHRLLAERRLNSELELMVQQRTQELEQALDQLLVANTELDKKSKQDRLTGLFNRGYMDEELPREIRRAKRSGQDLTLMMLDIDHFKALNDQHGHLLGDLVLTQLAELLQDLTQRGGDRVFRYGGEEFAILLPATDEIGARETANRIADAIRTMPIQYHDMQLQITVSIGIAVYYAATMEVTPEAFIGAADDALYQAKNAGRDQIRLARIEAPFR
jgi:diguanylate cyclase (GGDEF)-like protein